MRIKQEHKNRRALGAVKQSIDVKSCIVINVKQEGIWLDARKNFPTSGGDIRMRLWGLSSFLKIFKTKIRSVWLFKIVLRLAEALAK